MLPLSLWQIQNIYVKIFHLCSEIYFPSAQKIPLLYSPFLSADHCQELALGGSEDSTGDKSGATSQVLIMSFLHWKVFVKFEDAEAGISSNDFQTWEGGLMSVSASIRGA